MILMAMMIFASAILSAALIVALKPLLARYALARPNARSSHAAPTPQGGGIAVLAAALAIAAAGPFAIGAYGSGLAEWGTLAAAAVLLAVVGAVDDIRPLSPALRFVLQIIAVGAVVLVAGASTRLLPDAVPLWLERGLAVLAGVWFVNLVNFMDGIDWITVAEFVPLTAALVLFGTAGFVPLDVSMAAAALLGGLIGFAPFNKPVARLFLGDVGSLPIGLMAGWMLYRVALEGGVVAAVLLPLYYLADATITLFRRLARRERVWEAHRSHFYQLATANGLSVPAVVGRIFVLNLALAVLAAAVIIVPAWPMQIAALVIGATAVGLVLRNFATPHLERAGA